MRFTQKWTGGNWRWQPRHEGLLDILFSINAKPKTSTWKCKFSSEEKPIKQQKQVREKLWDFHENCNKSNSSRGTVKKKMMEGIELTDDVRTYEPLGSTARNFTDSSPEHNSNANAPKDTRNTVYLSLLTAGIGFVLPYNSFIIASDYWSERFPTRSVELDLSCTYIIVAFASVLLNNIFLSIAPFRVRILFGKTTHKNLSQTFNILCLRRLHHLLHHVDFRGPVWSGLASFLSSNRLLGKFGRCQSRRYRLYSSAEFFLWFRRVIAKKKIHSSVDDGRKHRRLPRFHKSSCHETSNSKRQNLNCHLLPHINFLHCTQLHSPRDNNRFSLHTIPFEILYKDCSPTWWGESLNFFLKFSTKLLFSRSPMDLPFMAFST